MPFTSASILPILAVGAYFAGVGDNLFNVTNFVLCIIGVMIAHLSSNVLNDYFGYDNNEFISFLEENNFHVVPHALTNYPNTSLSLASSLNMQYLDCVENSKVIREEFEEAESCFSASTAYEMVQNNEIMKKFNQEGYIVINSYSGIEPTRNFDIAFSNLCGRYSGIMNSELTITLIGKSILNPFYVELFEDVKRDQILCVLSELEEVHKKYDKSIFVFAHLMLPHSPYIFGPDGESVSPEKMEARWVSCQCRSEATSYSEIKIRDSIPLLYYL